MEPLPSTPCRLPSFPGHSTCYLTSSVPTDQEHPLGSMRVPVLCGRQKRQCRLIQQSPPRVRTDSRSWQPSRIILPPSRIIPSPSVPQHSQYKHGATFVQEQNQAQSALSRAMMGQLRFLQPRVRAPLTDHPMTRRSPHPCPFTQTRG